MPRPTSPAGLDPPALTAAHEATRALLAAASPREAVDVVVALVAALGGVVVPARLGGVDTLPLDLSFGVDEPLLARADPAGVPRLRLEVLLPTFVEDARRVVMKLRETARLRDEASTDPLTGLLNRRAWDRQSHRLAAGDTVAVLDLDHFARLTDSAGPGAGDAVLAGLGRLLRDFLRADDLAARHGGRDLVVGAIRIRPQPLHQRFSQLRRVWDAVRPHPVTFSVGVAAVTTTAAAAVHEAHDALSAIRPADQDRTQAGA
jgi:diguanylate cyclase (GGDEF)-like protein